MKVYGSDYFNQYNNLQKRLNSLDGKVRKRAKFLLANLKDLPFENEYKNINIDALSVLYLIGLINDIETKYASMSTQGNLFSK